MWMPNLNKIAAALARARSLKAREAALDQLDQRLRQEFDLAEQRKNDAKRRLRRGWPEPAAA
jgi:hypothetical protein